MKSTEIMRQGREARRAEKKQDILDKKMDSRSGSVGECINQLAALFFHDGTKIYNIESEEILLFLEEMKETQPEKQWGNIIRKAVKKTQIEGNREEAIKGLFELADIPLS